MTPPIDASTPATLRALPMKWATMADDGTLETLQAEADAHADAWDDDILRQDVYDENYRKERTKRHAAEAEVAELRGRIAKAVWYIYGEDGTDVFSLNNIVRILDPLPPAGSGKEVKE